MINPILGRNFSNGRNIEKSLDPIRSTNLCQEAGVAKRSKSIRKPVKIEASPEVAGFVHLWVQMEKLLIPTSLLLLNLFHVFCKIFPRIYIK